MWNSFKKKVKRQNGETLVESLVSILIGALSIAMLVSSILASAHINAQNRTADDKFNQDLLRAEGALEEEGYEESTATIELDFETSVDQELKVTLYGGQDSSFVTFQYNGEGD